MLEDVVAKTIGIVVAITIHQYVYALTSAKLGDPLPKKEKRLSLNPLKHIEPVGFILLYISMFGWGKPVNTNPSYYKNKKNSVMTVALSGIVANLLIAIISGALFKFLNYNYSVDTQINLNPIIMRFLKDMLNYIALYNIVLAVINLIPIYPLDGYKILLTIVKPNTYFKLIQYEKIIQMIVILLAFAGLLNMILNPIIQSLYRFCIL